jgi:hypothetical protein
MNALGRAGENSGYQMTLGRLLEGFDVAQPTEAAAGQVAEEVRAQRDIGNQVVTHLCYLAHHRRPADLTVGNRDTQRRSGRAPASGSDQNIFFICIDHLAVDLFHLLRHFQRH